LAGRLQPLHAVYRRAVISSLYWNLKSGELRPKLFFEKVSTRIFPEDDGRRVDPDGLGFVKLNLNTCEDYQSALRRWRARRAVTANLTRLR